MQSNLQQVYRESCTQEGMACNSEIARILPLDFEGASRVVELNLNKNYIGPRGIKPLLEAIEHCSSLRYLDLSSNFLDNASVEMLVAYLRIPSVWSSLLFLDLSHNPISNPSGRLLLKILDARPTLLIVGVNDTLMNAGLARRLDMICRRRNFSQRPAGFDDDKLMAAVRIHAKADGTHSDWSAMETIWQLAAVAAPPSDGWSGLASVMAVVRQDTAIASMY